MKLIEKTQSEVYDMITSGLNLIIYGNSGWGKTGMVRDIAEKTGKKLLVLYLATEAPEMVGGIPVPITKDNKQQFYTRLLNEQLIPVVEDEGKDWIILLDEANQAPEEVMNCLYGMAHPDPEERNFCGHPIPHAQVILTGNLDDGTDGTVYIRPLPTPLENRCIVVKLAPNKRDARNHILSLPEFKQIPEVRACVNEMLDNDINPRDVVSVLNLMLTHSTHPAFESLLECKLRNESLATKLIALQEKTAKLSPAEYIKNAKKVYAQFKAVGYVTLGTEKVTTEDELETALSSYLSEEEIQAVFNDLEGGE